MKFLDKLFNRKDKEKAQRRRDPFAGMTGFFPRSGAARPVKSKARIGALIRVLPGRRHALYESNIGPLRKPYEQTS